MSAFFRASLPSHSDLHYCAGGRKDAPPMILVHGMGGSHASWRMLLHFLGRQFRWYALDLPGHGQTSIQDFTPGVNAFAQLVTDFAAHFHWERFFAVGHSMGGQILLRASLQKSFAPQSMMLAAPAGVEPFVKLEASRLLSGLDWVQRQGMQWAQRWLDTEPNEEGFSRFSPWDTNQASVVSYCMQSMLEEPVYDDLPSLEIPTLIALGKQDRLIPNPIVHWKMSVKDLAVRHAGRIPGAQIRVVKDAGHFLHRSHPKTLFRLMRDSGLFGL
jgi:pimeloyl-ACP methyl ester carboxylesterase